MVYPYHEILFSNNNKQTIDTCNNMDESQRHSAKWKKPVSKGYLLYDSISLTFSKIQNCSDGEDVSSFQELGCRQDVIVEEELYSLSLTFRSLMHLNFVYGIR